MMTNKDDAVMGCFLRRWMGFGVVLVVLLLAACSPEPKPVERPSTTKVGQVSQAMEVNYPPRSFVFRLKYVKTAPPEPSLQRSFQFEVRFDNVLAGANTGSLWDFSCGSFSPTNPQPCLTERYFGYPNPHETTECPREDTPDYPNHKCIAPSRTKWEREVQLSSVGPTTRLWVKVDRTIPDDGFFIFEMDIDTATGFMTPVPPHTSIVEAVHGSCAAGDSSCDPAQEHSVVFANGWQIWFEVARTEIFNGIDDDLGGTVDECSPAGTWDCDAFLECGDDPVPGKIDCDETGVTSECGALPCTFASDHPNCANQQGVFRCEDGEVVCRKDAAEICDDQDNDCDGEVDNIPVTGCEPGICTSNGTAECVDGNPVIACAENSSVACTMPSSDPFCPGAPGHKDCTSACVADTGPTPSEGLDSDGDGLLDRWEDNGLDANCDGEIDVDFKELRKSAGNELMAKSDHKDLFLELDVMLDDAEGEDLALSFQEIQRVKAAFAAAPIDAGGVENPDGEPGIRLWVDTVNGDSFSVPLGRGGKYIPGEAISKLHREVQPGEPPLEDLQWGDFNRLTYDPCCADPKPAGCPAFVDCRFQKLREKNFVHPGCTNLTVPSPFCEQVQPFKDLVFRYGVIGLTAAKGAVEEDGAGAGSCTDGIDNRADEDPLSQFPDLVDTFTVRLPDGSVAQPDPDCSDGGFYDRNPFGAEDGGELLSCSDGVNGDGVMDEGDPDCRTDPVLAEKDGIGGFDVAGSCNDGEDSNRLRDGADGNDPDDCQGLTFSEDGFGPGACYDGVDNVSAQGGDGADGGDDECPEAPREDGGPFDSCYNGIDDSANQLPIDMCAPDGLIDLDDPDCAPLLALQEDGAGPNTCWDGLDNGDGEDEADRSGDCYIWTDKGEDGSTDPLTCVDGIDNGADRMMDEQDPDCYEDDCTYDENRKEDPLPGEDPGDPGVMDGTCGDDIDNSADLADGADESGDCPAIPTEGGAGPGSCYDNIDNDGDGEKDGGDSQCPQLPMEDNSGIPNSCTDGIDNGGGDGKDEDDPDCNVSNATYRQTWPREDGRVDATMGELMPPSNSCWDGIDNKDDGKDGTARECLFAGGLAQPLWGFLVFNQDKGASVMHEFGHLLGLVHGGPRELKVPLPGGGFDYMPQPFNQLNCKPNYVSVMNYDHASGILQRWDPTLGEMTAGDCNDGIDNDFDNRVDAADSDCRVGDLLFDFSPPRFPTLDADGNPERAADPFGLDLEEAAPDEKQIIDVNDAFNTIWFVDPSGTKQNKTADGYDPFLSENPDAPVEGGDCADGNDNDGEDGADENDPDCRGYDFNGNGVITGKVAAINLNTRGLRFGTTRPLTGCTNSTKTDQLKAANDWRHLRLPIVGEGAPAFAPVPYDPPVDLDERFRQQWAADVEIKIFEAPGVVVQNHRADLRVVVRNLGPQRTESAQVEFMLTEGLGFLKLPAGCTSSEGVATCNLGRMFPRTQVMLELAVEPISNPSADHRQMFATVTPVGGFDPVFANNSESVDVFAESDLEVLDVIPEVPSLVVPVGGSASIDVETVVVSNGPSNPVDAEIVVETSVTGNVTVEPEASIGFAPDLAETPTTITTTLNVTCDGMGDHVVTLDGSVTSDGAIYDDPFLDNNTATATFIVQCRPCLHATESLVLADRTYAASQQILGGTYFELGADEATVTGDVFVDGNAFLRSTAIVDGDLTMSGSRQDQGLYQVTGSEFPFTSVDVLPIATQSVPTGSGDQWVGVDQTATWVPGDYDDGFVGSRSVATLSAGTYNFRTLELDADGDLDLDTSAGPIVINVEESLAFGDRALLLTSDPTLVSFYSNANGTVRIGTEVHFNASLSAPAAKVHAYSRTVINGCLAADEIQFEPNVSLSQGADLVGCNAAFYEAEEMMHSTGGTTPGGWNIWSNGHIATTHDFSDGPATVRVTAKGQPASGIWPHMRVLVGGVLVDDFFVQASDWTPYAVSVADAEGEQEIRIEFDNDYYGGPGNDRDLLVDSVMVDCSSSTTSSVYDFESSAMGWTHVSSPGASSQVNTAQAYDGDSSLAFSVVGWGDPTIDVIPETSPSAGSTVTIQVFVPSDAPVTAVSPYVLDGAWSWTDGYTSSFAKGEWQTFTVTVPSNAVLPLNKLGVKFYMNSSYTGDLFVDAVDW